MGQIRLFELIWIAVFALNLGEFSLGGPIDLVCELGIKHDYYFGERKFYDELLLTVHVRESSSPNKQVVHAVTFPSKGYNASEITVIEAIDLNFEGRGACMDIIEGGIGSDRVTLLFFSQVNQSINHWVGFHGYIEN